MTATRSRHRPARVRRGAAGSSARVDGLLGGGAAAAAARLVLAAEPAGAYTLPLPDDAADQAAAAQAVGGRDTGDQDVQARGASDQVADGQVTGDEALTDPVAPGDALAVDVAAAQALEAELAEVVERLVALPVDGLDHEGLTRQLQSVEGAIRQLDARRCRLAAETTDRKAKQAQRHAAEQGRDGHRAGQRAAQQAENELAGQLQWSPGEAKRATRIGTQLGDQPEAQAAFDAGRLPPRHAQLLAETLAQLSGEARETAAARLVPLAARQDASMFGRSCRRVLAQLDAGAAQHREDRRHARRRAKLAPTEDGMLALSGQWAGLDAETLATAIDAFRKPDTSGGLQRSAEQRTADAVVELARAALRAGEAPTVHGVRPHISITIDYQQLLADAHRDHDHRSDAHATGADHAGDDHGGGHHREGHHARGTDHPGVEHDAEHLNGAARTRAGAAGTCGAGVVEAPWMGPLPFSEVRRLLADANVSRLLVDPHGVPVEAGEQTRTVPAGLWRALVARDGGCIAEGCDAPAGWCDVMHLATPHRLNGQLTIDTAALGCRHHHRQLDHHHWQTTWHQHRPTLRPPPT